MQILMRSEAANNWQVVGAMDYGDEAELHRLLAESPSLIPLEQIREGTTPLVAAVREVGLPGSGSTDIVAFSADGDIALIECKLKANAEIKREVIGQILEYAAFLWKMDYATLDDLVQRRSGKSLADLVHGAVDAGAWDEEAFRERITETLAQGTFALIIAVDTINEELSRTLRFLNGCGHPAFSFHALEMQRFQASGTEILVPQLHGPAAADKQQETVSRQWTPTTFLEEAQRRLPPEVTQPMAELLQWAQSNADQVAFGRGKAGSVMARYKRVDNKALSVFSMDTAGYLWVYFGPVKDHVSEEASQEYRRLITSIPSMRHLPAKYWPGIKIADAFVNQPGALEQFKAAIAQIGERIRQAGTT